MYKIFGVIIQSEAWSLFLWVFISFFILIGTHTFEQNHDTVHMHPVVCCSVRDQLEPTTTWNLPIQFASCPFSFEFEPSRWKTLWLHKWQPTKYLYHNKVCYAVIFQVRITILQRPLVAHHVFQQVVPHWLLVDPTLGMFFYLLTRVTL